MQDEGTIIRLTARKQQCNHLEEDQDPTEDTLLKAKSPKSASSKKKRYFSPKIRWLILALGILTNYGCFFCSDIPQPLQYYIQDVFKINDTSFNLLYSVTSLPNIIVPFFGGILLDSIGIRVTMVVTSLITVLGQSIITAGANSLNFHAMVFGRFLYGIGCNTFESSLLLIITKWFRNREMALAWGITRAFLRTSTALTSFLSPILYLWSNQIYVPFMFGLVLNVLSLFCVFGVAYIDKKAEYQLEENHPEVKSEKILIKDLKNFSKLFYLMMAVAVLTYMSFLGFTNNVNNLLVIRFGFTSKRAGLLITTIYLIAAVLSPIFGRVVDKIGRRVLFLLTAATICLLSNACIMVLEDRPQGSENYGVMIGFAGFGLFYAIFSTTFWTSLALIVKPQVFGTAVGIISCFEALTQTLFPEILGLIHDNSIGFHSGYFFTQVAHCGVLLLVVFILIWAYFVDLKTDGKLDKLKANSDVKKNCEKEKSSTGPLNKID